jgi:hypothetical protein
MSETSSIIRRDLHPLTVGFAEVAGDHQRGRDTRRATDPRSHRSDSPRLSTEQLEPVATPEAPVQAT